MTPNPPTSLERRLGEALERLGVRSCRDAAARPDEGRDHPVIDLLVDRATAPDFATAAARLGFKRLQPDPAAAPLDTERFCGFDPATDALVSVRVHYRLTVRSGRSEYALPIEQALFDATAPGDPFRTPAAEFQLLLCVIRELLDPAGRDLADLRRRADHDRVRALLARSMPWIDAPLFEACERAVQPRASWWARASARRALRRALRPLLPWRTGMRRADGARLASGGRVIALVGGDGSGKTTCARELSRWLGEACDTMTVNLAWPRRSLLSLVVGGTLRMSAVLAGLFVAEPIESPTWNDDGRRSRGYLALLRQVCHARDQHRLALEVHRFAGAGGVVLCERYPVAHGATNGKSELGDPPPPSRLKRLLRDTEAAYQFAPPDQVIVLRVEPELAVRRKPGEPEDHVRRHAQVIWETDWTSTRALVVDAGRPLPEVLAAMKTAIWSEL